MEEDAVEEVLAFVVGGRLVDVEVLLMFKSEKRWVTDDEFEIRRLRRGVFSTRLLRDEDGGLDVDARTGLELGGGQEAGEVVVSDKLVCLDAEERLD